MMKDPRYTDTEAWVDALSLRIRRFEHFKPQIESAIEDLESEQQQQHLENTDAAGLPSAVKFSRASRRNIETIRDLPEDANILLFTPVIIPAGQKLETLYENEPATMDPFEHFGKALSIYHRRIRHVPYLITVGFTATHHAFVSEADAVITVVCEPDADLYPSVAQQMRFAEMNGCSWESEVDDYRSVTNRMKLANVNDRVWDPEGTNIHNMGSQQHCTKANHGYNEPGIDKFRSVTDKMDFTKSNEYIREIQTNKIHGAAKDINFAKANGFVNKPVDKYRSMSNQMDFAEAALDSIETKEANAADAHVLIQCGANEYRSPVDGTFMNVIECKAYNAKIAQGIAQTIFMAPI